MSASSSSAIRLFVGAILIQIPLGLALVSPKNALFSWLIGMLLCLGAFKIQAFLFKEQTPLNPAFWTKTRLARRSERSPAVLGGYPLEETKAQTQLEALASFSHRESIWIRASMMLYPILCGAILSKLGLFPVQISTLFSFWIPLALIISACVIYQFFIPVGICAAGTLVYLLSESNFSSLSSPLLCLAVLAFGVSTFLSFRLGVLITKDQKHPSPDFKPRSYQLSQSLPGLLAATGLIFIFGFIFTRVFPDAPQLSGFRPPVDSGPIQTQPHAGSHPISSAEAPTPQSGAGSAAGQSELGGAATSSNSSAHSATSTSAPSPQQESSGEVMGEASQPQQAQASSGDRTGEAAETGRSSGESSSDGRTEIQKEGKLIPRPPKLELPKIPPDVLKRAIILIGLVIGFILLTQFLKKQSRTIAPSKKNKVLSPAAKAALLANIREIEARNLSPEQEIIEKYCAFLKAMENTENPWPKHLPPEIYTDRLGWTHGVIQAPLKQITWDHSDCYYGSLSVTPSRLAEFRAHYKTVLNRIIRI